MNNDLILLPLDVDELEWDADDKAGDPNAYDGEAVEYIEYDHSAFTSVHPKEVITVGND